MEKIKFLNNILSEVVGDSVHIEDPETGIIPVNKDEYRELSKEMALQAISFWQNLLLASSGIVGILVSFHSNSQSNQYIRWAYLLAILFLSLGSISCGIALYKRSKLFRNARQELIREYIDANKQGKNPKRLVFVGKERSGLVELLAFVLLLLGGLSLVSYAFLKELL